MLLVLHASMRLGERVDSKTEKSLIILKEVYAGQKLIFILKHTAPPEETELRTVAVTGQSAELGGD